MTLVVHLKYDVLPLVDEIGHSVNDPGQYEFTLGLDSTTHYGPTGSSVMSLFPDYQEYYWVGNWDVDHLGFVTNGKLTVKTKVYNPYGSMNPEDNTATWWDIPLGGPAIYDGTHSWVMGIGRDPAIFTGSGYIRIHGGYGAAYNAEFPYDLPAGQWVEIAMYVDGTTATVYADNVFVGTATVMAIPYNPEVGGYPGEFVTSTMQTPTGGARVDEHQIWFNEASPPVSPPPVVIPRSPTGVRFPVDLPQPVIDGYSFASEDNRSRFEACAGRPRRRNTMRFAPTRFSAQWVFTQAQYDAFDRWWQNDVRGGALLFDIQLPSPLGYLAWYTCQSAAVPTAESADGNNWRVTMALRSPYAVFYDRPPGTDELKGTASLGIPFASGNLELAAHLFGTTLLEVTPRGTLGATGLLGKILGGGAGIQTARGRIAPTVYLYGIGDNGVAPVGELDWLVWLYGLGSNSATPVGELERRVYLYGLGDNSTTPVGNLQVGP